jgi:hypothetical protein
LAGCQIAGHFSMFNSDLIFSTTRGRPVGLAVGLIATSSDVLGLSVVGFWFTAGFI